MGNSLNIETELANRLRRLRIGAGWSLAELEAESGVSRSTLSRLENADVSPTTQVLAKLCQVYGLTMSRLLSLVERQFDPLIRKNDQRVWRDDDAGFERISVSPPANGLSIEVIKGRLKPGVDILYEASPKPGLEHHLVMLSGELRVTIENNAFELTVGDSLRYCLHGASRFENHGAMDAVYHLVMGGRDE